MYSEILINKVFKGYEVTDGDAMQNLSRINILIGKNNSGKSRFMRRIFSSSNIKSISQGIRTNSLKELFEKIKSGATAAVNDLKGKGWQLVPGLEKASQLEIDALWIDPGQFVTAFESLNQLQGLYDFRRGVSNEVDVTEHFLLQELQELHEIFEADKSAMASLQRIYIPVLRGLRPLQITGQSSFESTVDNYQKRTRVDYFKEEEWLKEDSIVTGLHLYEEIKSLVRGKVLEREKKESFEKFIGDTFFDGLKFTITSIAADDVVHVQIGTDARDEKPIYALGDGIQAIIILTYPLFFHESEQAIICYEEPENHLHPGLQRLFINTLLLSRFQSFQYFITTHSNHFLDLTADYNNISVYTFSKKEDEAEETFAIENVENGNSNVLELIGARASSVFLSNCTIWIEGITDRLYLRKYLEVYQAAETKKYKEDYHFSFVEYGGNNITHWSFLDADDPAHLPITVERLCAKLFLITDKDDAGLTRDGTAKKSAGKKYQRHQQLKQKLKERYYCLQCREIENLLSKKLLKAAIVRREGHIALDFTQFDRAGSYNNERLGTFIEKKVLGVKKKWSADSGTLHDKLGFCKLAIDEIKSVDDLSDEGRELAKKLYNFIAAHN